MSELVDRLAELTAHRDRDVLDVALVTALHDMFLPQQVSVHRAVGDAGGERWLTRARMAKADVAAQADDTLADIEHLQTLASRPAWRDCLVGQQVIALDDGGGAYCTTLFPLSTDAGPIGVVELRTDRPLLPSERRAVGSILRICRNFESLLDYSERDTLTGLLNRKTFDAAFLKVALAPSLISGPLPEERRDAGPAQHFMGVIDIDHFKRVNDTYGHLIGDEVLLLMARLMRATFRYHDRLYRFGGEEFVVLLRCRDEDSAGVAFERLRANVEQYPFPQVGHITISAGFSRIRANDTPAGAFERADRAVYFAKGNGRNQVRCHETLVHGGQLDDGQQMGDVELF